MHLNVAHEHCCLKVAYLDEWTFYISGSQPVSTGPPVSRQTVLISVEIPIPAQFITQNWIKSGPLQVLQSIQKQLNNFNTYFNKGKRETKNSTKFI